MYFITRNEAQVQPAASHSIILRSSLSVIFLSNSRGQAADNREGSSFLSSLTIASWNNQSPTYPLSLLSIQSFYYLANSIDKRDHYIFTVKDGLRIYDDICYVERVASRGTYRSGYVYLRATRSSKCLGMPFCLCWNITPDQFLRACVQIMVFSSSPQPGHVRLEYQSEEAVGQQKSSITRRVHSPAVEDELASG